MTDGPDMYDQLVSDHRADCYCAPYRKPCSSCQEFADGVEAGMASRLEEISQLKAALTKQFDWWFYVMCHPEDAELQAREALGMAVSERDEAGHIVGSRPASGTFDVEDLGQIVDLAEEGDRDE